MTDLIPEQRARLQIDPQLADCGWMVQNFKAVDFSDGSGISLCEVPLTTGRCAELWPHGDVIRQEEADMRRKLIVGEVIECILGLGPNRFYNSPVEARVVISRTQKHKARRGKIPFNNAVNEVTRERAGTFLTDEHILHVVRAYRDFTRVVPIEEIRAKDGNLSIPLYVGGEKPPQMDAATKMASTATPNTLAHWMASRRNFRRAI